MEKTLKLDLKRTFYIGFAFFAILMVWQIYNHYAPLFLDQMLKANLQDETQRWYIIGIIMAMDNFFALFMLPLFGALSDKTLSKHGKRMPYIIVGMVLSIIIFPMIAVFYFGDSIVGVIIFMGLTLVVMNVYRSPAVSLMPDVTPKPLRSKANGIINLVGYIGAILAGGLAIVFKFTEDNNNYLVPFLISSVFLFIALVLLLVKIRENKILAEVKEDMELGEQYALTEDTIEENKPLSKKDKKNLIILLISVFLWFASFNAVETFLSVYAENVLGNSAIAGTAVIILTVSSIITFIPAGILSTRFGRKNIVVFGLFVILFALILLILIKDFNIFMILSFVLAGVGWASINVNSYPMLVEMTHKGNIGKYTGLYYTFSMLAQSFTPIIAGAIMTFLLGPEPLFYYSAVLMALATFVFITFKENKAAVKKQKTLLESFDND